VELATWGVLVGVVIVLVAVRRMTPRMWYALLWLVVIAVVVALAVLKPFESVDVIGPP
jgi:beta-lactamase regulating signal transducer with metallopeptidase domain